MLVKGKHLKVIPDDHNLFKISVSKAKTFKRIRKRLMKENERVRGWKSKKVRR